MKAKLRGGFMAARAEAGGKMKNAGNRPIFDDIDTDGDGEVSAEEFAAHQGGNCRHHRGGRT